MLALIRIIFYKKAPVSWYRWLVDRIVWAFAFFGIFVLIFVSIAFYYQFSPAKLSTITLTNGVQRVVFVGMSHIASADFYAEKQSQLEDLAQSGVVFLLE